MSDHKQGAEFVCSYTNLNNGEPVIECFSRIGDCLISDLWLTQYKIIRETNREVIGFWPYSDEIVTVGPEKGRILAIDKRNGQFRNFSFWIPARDDEFPGLAGPCVIKP